jgi:dimethylhistidine N-methyltransferase
MPRTERSHILSEGQQNLWHSIEPSIWRLDAGGPDQDSSLLILRTLLDQPRWLEAYHLYDERGSRLFEKICELPEYYLTRTENAILAEEASKIIAHARVECIVELGAGFSRKTMHLLKEQIRQRGGGTFAPIDVSLTGLAASRDVIQREFPELGFHGLESRFEAGLAAIDKSVPTLVVFLGSTIGNFTPPEFVRFFEHLSLSMGPEDFLLLGVDRVKETELLEKAYSDSRGVTAEFILNVFAHINSRAESNFDLKKMRYHSRYNVEWRQIEMYAVSTSDQEIRFPRHSTAFVWKKDERILVEISRKFEPARLQKQLEFFGFKTVGHFTDPKGWFSVFLLKRSP